MVQCMQWRWAIVVMLFAGVHADSLDDFTNNLFTDLAPILTLLGERVTMQFMSQSLGLADCLVLAVAPLGIITILVSAIRVGGPMWLKAAIGRAKEDKTVAEMEVMTSTSQGVYELYSRGSIIRCQGTAPILEYICLIPEDYDRQEKQLLRYMTLEDATKGISGTNSLLSGRQNGTPFLPAWEESDQVGMRGSTSTVDRETGTPATAHVANTPDPQPRRSRLFFVTGETQFPPNGDDIESGGLNDHSPESQQPVPPQPSGTQQPHGVEGGIKDSCLTVIYDASPEAPNISLNLQNAQSRTGIRFAALVGVILQTAVLVFFGIMTHHPKAKTIFQKDDQPVAPSAFPLAAGGTVLLVFGLYVCALVVTISNRENIYKAREGYKIHIHWLQQGQNVSDQVFQSYAISPSKSLRLTSITKSIRAISPRKDSQEISGGLQMRTVAGVVISLLGFIIQFVGLRAMNSAAALAQLAAVGIMTPWRALVRPGFSSSFKTVSLLQDFELDWFAWELMTLGRAEETGSDNQGRSDLPNSDNNPDSASDQPLSTGDAEEHDTTPRFWTVVTGQETERKKFKWVIGRENVQGPISKAEGILTARGELARLAKFQGKTSPEATNLALAIEKALEVLFPHGPSEEGDGYWVWPVNVAIALPSFTEGSERGTDVCFDLRYKDGSWKILAHGLDAALSLWVYTIRQQQFKHADQENDEDAWLRRTIEEPSLRLFGPEKNEMKGQLLHDLSLWMPGSSESLLEVRECSQEPLHFNARRIHRSRVVGCKPPLLGNSAGRNGGVSEFRNFEILSTTRDQASDAGAESEDTILAIETYDSIENLFAKDMLYSFMCSAATTLKESGATITGKTELRTTPATDWWNQESEFLWNQDLSNLSEAFTSLGFGSDREVLSSIISPLSMAQILPFPHALFDSVRERAAERLGEGDSDGTFRIYETLLEKANDYKSGETGIWECAFALLNSLLKNAKRQVEELKYEELVDGTALLGLQEVLQFCLKYPIPETSAFIDLETRFTSPEVDLDTSWLNKRLPPSVELKSELNKRDMCGRVILHYAAVDGTVPKLFDLAKRNVPHKPISALLDLNAKDYHGYTPLHYSCKQGFDESVGKLLEAGAKLDIQASDGMCPLHLAVRWGKANVIKTILKWTMQPDRKAPLGKLDAHWRVRDYGGRIPLHWAVIRGQKDITEMLKANVDEADYEGWTSLHLAVLHYEPDIFSIVCESSADINKSGRVGYTALSLACDNGRWEAAERLIEKGADVHVKDSKGRTVLGLAAARGAGKGLAQALLGKNFSVEERVVALRFRKMYALIHYPGSEGEDDVLKCLNETLEQSDAERANEAHDDPVTRFEREAIQARYRKMMELRENER